MVSAAITAVVTDGTKFLLVKRSDNSDAFPSMYSLPGGFLDAKTSNSPGETLEETVIRELKEETGLNVSKNNLELFAVYSDPDIDPRAHVINACYIVHAKEQLIDCNYIIHPQDDISDYCWVYDLPNYDLAFNHFEIFKNAISFLNSKKIISTDTL